MRGENTLMIRYVGTDYNRTFLIQRGDGQFWTGNGFSVKESDAEIFDDKHKCQLTRNAIRHGQYAGQPVRTFTFKVSLTLVGHEAKDIDMEELTEFLMAAANLNIDAGAHGDGPRETMIELFMRFKTLRETKPPRDVY